MPPTDKPLALPTQHLLDAARQAEAANHKLLADAVDGGQHCASAVGIPGSKLVMSGIHHMFGKSNMSKGDDVESCVKTVAEVAKTVGPPITQKLKEAAHAAAPLTQKMTDAAAPLAERAREAALKAKQAAQAALQSH